MKTKVLMVCLGNICRSPLAEGILKLKVDSDKVFVDSAGTGAWHTGELPDKRSIKVAKEHHIDLTNQRARQFKKQDFKDFDYIYVMDQSNYDNVISLAETASDKGKVKLIMEESDLNIKNVPDPYYGGEDGFENVYKMLDNACTNIQKKLSDA
jgi:protein-tyrosine phosphatase